MQNLDVPFYANPDEIHCFQACLSMVLKYFLPASNYTFEQLDELSGRKVGKWTWPLKALGELHNLGLEIEIVDNFDYEKFLVRPNEYLVEVCGPEGAAAQIANSDIPYEVETARLYSYLAGKPDRPTPEHLIKLIEGGSLPICHVNLAELHAQPGYIGHFVVVINANSDTIVIHDPGIATEQYPPRENFSVSIETFRMAGGYIMAISSPEPRHRREGQS